MKEIDFEIGFDDSSFLSCEMINDQLTIRLKSWDNKIIKVVFSNTIRYTYNIGSFISGLYEISNKDKFFLEALAAYYEKTPIDSPFKHYVVMDIDDCYLFEIVAEKVSAIKKEFN